MADVVPFFAAVRSGDRETVARMLAADAALVAAHDPDAFGGTALIHATLADDRAMVDLLLDAGADVDQRSDWWAGSFGVLDHGSDAMCADLLERGATLTPHAAARLGMLDELRDMLDTDPALAHARGGDGQFPLHFARTNAIADLLLHRGADLDGRDLDHGSTAAQWMGGQRWPVAAHLVECGATVDAVLAARVGDVARLEAVIADTPGGVGLRISRETFPVPEPAAGHIYIFTIGDGSTLLHAAAGTDRAASIAWLLAHDADPNARGGYDDATPLHQAAWADAPEAAAALLDGGADMNARSGKVHDNEAVGWAIVSGAERVVRLLLDRGCTLNDTHRADAVAGAKGEFRSFNRNRPMEKWAAIAKMVGGDVNG